MPFPKATGDDVRITLGSGETAFKTGDFYFSGAKLYYIKNLLRNGNPVFINQASAQGDLAICHRHGEYTDAPKTTGQAWVIGEDLYWDPATKKLTNVAGSLKLVAEVIEAAISGATVGVIALKV